MHSSTSSVMLQSLGLSRAPSSMGNTSSSASTSAVELIVTHCDACGVGIMGASDSQNFQQHLNGKSHKKNVASAAAKSNGGVLPMPTTACGASGPTTNTAATSTATTWPPEVPFIALTASGQVHPNDLHRILSYRLVCRDELSNGRHPSATEGVVLSSSPLKDAIEHMHTNVVRTVLAHRPDAFVLQHIDGKCLKELQRSIARSPAAKETYEVFQSPRIPEHTQPWTHHMVGYRRSKYTLHSHRLLLLHELVAQKRHVEPLYQAALATVSMNVDFAVGWMLLLEDVCSKQWMMLVSVELPHGPDLDLFRACCVRELQRVVGSVVANLPKHPAVVMAGDFGGPPSGMSYSYQTSLSAPCTDQLPIRIRRDALFVRRGTAMACDDGRVASPPHANDSAEGEKELWECSAWFDINVQFPGQLDNLTSISLSHVPLPPGGGACTVDDRSGGDVAHRQSTEWQRTIGREGIDVSLWNGHSLETIAEGMPWRVGPSDAGGDAACNSAAPTVVPLTNSFVAWDCCQRKGSLTWRVWRPRGELSLCEASIVPEAMLVALEGAVRLHGISFAPLHALAARPCAAFGKRWDDAVPGIFRSAYSHYQLMCAGTPDAQIPIGQEEACIQQLLLAAGNGSVGTPPPTTSKGAFLSTVVQRYLQRPSTSTISEPLAPFVSSQSMRVSEWCARHNDSPFVPKRLSEPAFTCFLPLKGDVAPPVAPCRSAANFTTHFDRRRWQDKHGGFEFGTMDYVLYLRDRMEVVRMSRLPTLLEIGWAGLPTVDGQHPSGHLPLCVDFWVPR